MQFEHGRRVARVDASCGAVLEVPADAARELAQCPVALAVLAGCDEVTEDSRRGAAQQREVRKVRGAGGVETFEEVALLELERGLVEHETREVPLRSL